MSPVVTLEKNCRRRVRTRASTDKTFMPFFCIFLVLDSSGLSKSSNRRSSNARARARFRFRFRFQSRRSAEHHRSSHSRDDSLAARGSSRRVTFKHTRFPTRLLKHPRQHASSSRALTTKRRWRLATVDKYALVVDTRDTDAIVRGRDCGRTAPAGEHAEQ